jgi:cytochrome c biogenesis protein CcmG/thiol:disulfide interchange protein DsbE
MQRVAFVLGWASAFLGVRTGAAADNVPEPARTGTAGKPAPTPKPLVHGATDITSLPKHRPIIWKMDVLDGPPFDLSAHRGKVVFINIFATWCGPCRLEQPAVVAFAKAHPDDTVVIGMDYEEWDDKVRAYRKTFAIPYPIAMDRRGTVLRGVYKGDEMIFPMTMVFHPAGTLSSAWAGNASREWLESEREAALSDPAT